MEDLFSTHYRSWPWSFGYALFFILFSFVKKLRKKLPVKQDWCWTTLCKNILKIFFYYFLDCSSLSWDFVQIYICRTEYIYIYIYMKQARPICVQCPQWIDRRERGEERISCKFSSWVSPLQTGPTLSWGTHPSRGTHPSGWRQLPPRPTSPPARPPASS